MKSFKDFSSEMANAAGEIMLANFSLGMKKEWKADNTPITVTDRDINRLVIESLKRDFPQHALLGEEESNMKNAEYVWVCDPVDGTTPFAHGYPTFMFSLALTHHGESVLGILHDPISKRTFYAEKGKGAVLNGEAIHVSKARTLKNALINLDADYKLIGLRKMLIDEYDVFATTLYCSTYGASLAACGEFIANVYEYTKPWDGAAVKIIVEEAGGKVTDILGNEQRYDRPINGFVASNGILHKEILNLIRKSMKY